MMFPFFVIIVYYFSGNFIMTKLVEDKEKRFRETLKIMSLSHNMYTLSYFLFSGLVITA